MKFSIAKVLEHIPPIEGIEQKKLERILKLTKKSDKITLDIAISALNKLGVLEIAENDNITNSLDESFIETRLRCSSKGYCFAHRDDGRDDIYIRDHNLNHAWNGDQVLVKVTKEGFRRRSPEGSIQCILERNTNNLLGYVEQTEDGISAKPLDDRVNANIKLSKTDLKYLSTEENPRLVDIKIDKYPIGQYPAEGHVNREIILDGKPKSDRDLLLTKANLNPISEPPKAALKKPSPKNREDLTALNTILFNSWNSINAPQLVAVDIDTKPGGFKIWVHSPAISERLVIGNALDTWIQDNGEAICLGEFWKMLLPDELASVSSFSPNKTSEAISLYLEVNLDGTVEDWRFALTNIKPKVLIDQKQLNLISQRKPKARTVPILLKPVKDYISVVQTLIYASGLIHNSQKSNGLLELDLPIPCIDNLYDILDEHSGMMLKNWVLPFTPNRPNLLLQPLIRLSNFVWSQHIVNNKLPGFSINYPILDQNLINEIAKSAYSLDIKLELDNDGVPIPDKLIEAIQNSKYKRVLEKQIKHLLPEIVVVMNKAATVVNSGDECLNKNLNNTITPWTLPTIHYIDIINQNTIVTLLNEGKKRSSTKTKKRLDLGCKNSWKELDWDLFTEGMEDSFNKIFTNALTKKINTTRKKTYTLHQEIISMAQTRSAEPLVGEEVDGLITGVQSYGFFAEIQPSMVEGLVHVSTLNDDWYEYRSRQNKLVGRKNNKTYQLGDTVRLRIIKVDVLRNQVDLEIVSDEILISANENDLQLKEEIAIQKEE